MSSAADRAGAARTLAARAGAREDLVADLLAADVLPTEPDGRFGERAVRRIRVIDGLERGGITRHVLADGLRDGALSLDFVDQPSYDRFSAFEDITWAELSAQRDIPIDVLLVVPVAMGRPAPAPTDHVRSTDLAVLPFIQTTLRAGVRPALVERSLRVAGDGLRRLAETEADWWWSDIQEPLLRAGLSPAEVGARTEAFATALGPATDEAVTAIYHGQQANAWMRNIFGGFEEMLAHAGLHTRPERVPAICFLDVTGYGLLTEAHGDQSAADVAGRFARLVERIAARHGGRTVKWLGDGVMLFNPEPGPAVLGALEMLEALGAEGLPPAHAGIHAGPVLFQEGDYFGRTVNAAARIAGHAGQGQVVVSRQVVEAAAGLAGVAFDAIGPVELKNLAAPLDLFVARRENPA